jgi:hypothetical protein
VSYAAQSGDATQQMDSSRSRQGPRRPICSSPSGAAFFQSVRADRLLTPCLPERDGRRVLRLEMGLAANQVCSPEGRGEHTNPAKLFEMVEFPVSPPVNPMPTCRSSRIRDSSGTPAPRKTVSDGLRRDSSYSAAITHEKRIGNEPFSKETSYFFGSVSEITREKRPIFKFFRVL